MAYKVLKAGLTVEISKLPMLWQPVGKRCSGRRFQTYPFSNSLVAISDWPKT